MKKNWLALMLALILVLTSLSAFADESAPAATAEAPAEEAVAEEAPAAEEATEEEQEPYPVFYVNGEVVMSNEVDTLYKQLAQQAQVTGVDLNQEENRKDLLRVALDTLVKNKVMDQKIAELGFDQFSEDEVKTLQTNAETEYGQYLAFYKALMFDDAKTDEEIEQEAVDMLNEVGYTKEKALENQKESVMYRRLVYSVSGDISIPDDAVQNAYDTAVEEAKARYAEDLTAYYTEKSNGSIMTYVPAGYRLVKHILVMFDEASELRNLTVKIADMAEDDAEYADTKARIDEITASIQPKLDEITAKIEAGEDFNALIEEYGEDPGMASGSDGETGYYMCEGIQAYVTEFTEGGMALEKVGDISDPILSAYGYHYIRYDSDVEESAVPFEDVQDALKSQLYSEALTANFNTKLTEWLDEAVIQYPKNSQNSDEETSEEVLDAIAEDEAAVEAPVEEAVEAE